MSEERWRKLFESVPVGVVVTNLNQRYVAANPATPRPNSVAYPRPTSPMRKIDPLPRRSFAAHVAGESYERDIEKRSRRKDGGTTWVEVSAFPAPIAGDAHLLGGVVVDVTERRAQQRR
jgi:PAS domain-containing protein